MNAQLHPPTPNASGYVGEGVTQVQWLVWVGGSPVRPEVPLDLDEAIAHFRDQAEMAIEDATFGDDLVPVEIRVHTDDNTF